MTSTTSPFRVRGVIEGFYGNPWTHDQRLELIEFIAQRGMNAFVYAPKDDALVRREWRLAYAGTDLARLAELVARCRDLGVTFVFTVSPGLSIRYSDPIDATTLCAKLDSVGGLGVSSFGLLLDDIPFQLQHPADRLAFEDLVAAQIALVRQVADHLGAERGLVVCPTRYWGRGDEPEISRLGQALDERLDLFWTGRTICSPTLELTDATTLCAKLDSVAGLGVSSFGLLLDDIPFQLQHPADRLAFEDLVAAQIALVRQVADHLGAERGLVVCPTRYWGRGDEPEISRLGQALDERLDLFWTGRTICSPTLELTDAAIFADATGRPPTYWDNYPVNDAAMTHELHIGPYRGRDPELWRSAAGVVANGMELFESSKIAFATIADYLRDPETYDPESSWRAAMRTVVGDADLAAFALFADNVRSSCLALEDAPLVTHAMETFSFGREFGDGAAAAADLRLLADRLIAAADHLLRGPVVNAALIDEARPWIEAFEVGAQALRRIADLARDGRLDADGPSELLPFLRRLRQARVRVFGDTVDMALADLTGTHPRPGDFTWIEGGGS